MMRIENYHAAVKMWSVHGRRRPSDGRHSVHMVWLQHVENGLRSFDDTYLHHNHKLKQNVR